MEWLVLILHSSPILIKLVQEVQGAVILCTISGSICELDHGSRHLVRPTLPHHSSNQQLNGESKHLIFNLHGIICPPSSGQIVLLYELRGKLPVLVFSHEMHHGVCTILAQPGDPMDQVYHEVDPVV